MSEKLNEKEITILGEVYAAMSKLPNEARLRIMEYLASRFCDEAKKEREAKTATAREEAGL